MPGSVDNLDPVDGFEEFLRATHFNKGVASQDSEGDDGAKAKGVAPAYFDIKTTLADTITIRGGVVRQSGRGLVVVADTPITPAGSAMAPNYAVIKISAYGTLTAVIECVATYPEDDGSWLYRALWEVYQVEGVAKVGVKCDEVAIRNPIGP